MAFRCGVKVAATVATALAALAIESGPARGQVLGEASGYTEFIFGDSTRHGDTTGAVAVGGKADFQSAGSFTIENDGHVANTLVVGGNLTGQFGTIGQNFQSGSTYVGGNLNFSDPSIYGHVNIKGDTTLSNFGNIFGNLVHQGAYSNPNTGISGTVSQASVTLPIHFSSDQSILTALSAAQYKSTDPIVGYTSGNGNLLSFGASGAGTSYFNVNPGVLAGSTGISIVGNANQSVVINVGGTADSLPNVGYSLSGGITVDHVLFNFYQATSLSLTSAKGSILAPLASVSFPSGSLDGSLIAASLTGGGETHVYEGGGGSGQITPFDGGLRTVPEPASLALMAAGGLALLGHAWRRTRRPA